MYVIKNPSELKGTGEKASVHPSTQLEGGAGELVTLQRFGLQFDREDHLPTEKWHLPLERLTDYYV